MFGAIPGTASDSSLKRRGAVSSDSTSRRLQRSPTRSRAVPSALGAPRGSFEADIGVVEVDTSGAKPLPWSSNGATIGTAVFAAAATPTGGARVSFGFVSSVERAFRGPGARRISGSVEHTAPLAPGSSGSPLVDSDGALIALNTNRVGEGFYLALPADATLKSRVDA